MTSPTPVFHRFRPLITVNGQKKRIPDDRFTEQQEQLPPSASEPPPPPSSSHQEPDDRWWQFTLPTKYRRKVEEYLSRGGQGIGGVHHLHDPSSGISPNSTPPRMEMVEIDEDRRKIIALLKRHASPSQTRQSSVDSNDPQSDLPHPYSSISIISPSFRLLHDDTIRLNAPNPPTDFPLPTFSRKMSLTPQQHEQFLQTSHHTTSKNPFDESARSMDMPTNSPHGLSGLQFSSSGLGSRSMSNYYENNNSHNKSRTARISFYFIHHPSAPLLCRLLNFILTVSSLAICVTIRKIESHSNLRGILGSSTLFILVVAPLGLVHNLFAIYCEYFGAPIGIWSVSWKMFHTLSELVFVSLWSAGLALSMNDALQSPLRCSQGGISDTSVQTMSNRNVPADLEKKIKSISGTPLSQAAIRQLINTVLVASSEDQSQINTLNQIPSSKLWNLCHLQASLVSITFAGLALYSVVLVVSLLRIFLKVSRKY